MYWVIIQRCLLKYLINNSIRLPSPFLLLIVHCITKEHEQYDTTGWTNLLGHFICFPSILWKSLVFEFWTGWLHVVSNVFFLSDWTLEPAEERQGLRTISNYLNVELINIIGNGFLKFLRSTFKKNQEIRLTIKINKSLCLSARLSFLIPGYWRVSPNSLAPEKAWKWTYKWLTK